MPTSSSLPSRRHRALPLAVLVGALLGALGAATVSGCARPLPGRTLDPVADLAQAPSPLPAPLDYERALRIAVADSPELRALALAVEGAGGWPAAEPLGLSAGGDADDRPQLGVSIDLLSVLGLGPQRAERALARLRRNEATLALHARTREVAGELAQAYAVAAVLTSMPAATCAVCDAEAFVSAGLAPSAAARASEAAAASLGAEVRTREVERETARHRIRRLLGRGPQADLELATAPAAWPEVPAAEPARLLAASPAVQRRIGAYEVARGELLRAQSARDPGIVLDPALALDPTHFFGALTLRLPVGAGPAIRAAHARMEAARLSVRAAVLEALEAAAVARNTWEAAEAGHQAARARREAAQDLAEAERARVEAQGEGFTEAVLAVNAVVDALRVEREALLAATRARVQAALAAGWPESGLPSGSSWPRTPPIPDAVPSAAPTETP